MLEASGGLRVRVQVAESPTAGLWAVKRRDVDVGLFPLFQYLLAHKEYGATALLQIVRHGGSHSYLGEILVRADSDISSLEKLAGKRVAYVNEFSVSGYILPAAMLAEKHIDVDSVFAGSHEAALEQLRAGKVDAAMTYAGASGGDPAFRVLTNTSPVPNEPLFVDGRMDKRLQEQVKTAFLKVAGSPDGKKLLFKFGAIEGFAPITDDAYRDVIPVFARAGQFIQEAAPGGGGLTWASPPYWPLY